MIDVLIVEDNQLALKYITKMTNWESYGFRIVATAPDGEEGLKSYFSLHPKLIITDIQMPVISGVELAKRVRAADKSARIIFLTSYQEFGYAKSAIDLEVSYYLLKHELKEQSLLKILDKVKADIAKEMSMSRLKLESDMAESIFGNRPLRDERRKDSAKYAFFAFERDTPLEAFKDIVRMKELDVHQVKNTCYEIGEKVAGLVNESGVFLLLCILTNENANEFAYELKDTLERNFTESFSVFVIDENIFFSDCKTQFLACKDMIERKIFYRCSAVLNTVVYGDFSSTQPTNFDYHLFREAIEARDTGIIVKTIDICFYSIIKNQDYDGLLTVSRKLIGILRSFQDSESQNIDQNFVLFDENDMRLFYTAKGIAEFFRVKFVELIEYLENDKSRKYSTAVRQAIKYISESYMDINLSVEDIALKTGVGANRLGIIFKQETGQSIREFLNEYRVEKSKQLIEKGLMMSEIHNMVGYLSIQYFSKVFQRITGVTPSEYKKEKKREASKQV